jgi:asparagine synthase (glutamine-hydrolysing)
LANGRGKVILRRLAERWFPSEYINKPKRGFIVPLKDWMKNEMAGDLDDLTRCDLLSPRQVARFVSLQRSSSRDYSSLLWRLMVLNRWLKQWRPQLN